MSDLYLYNPDICDGDEIWKPVAGYEDLYEVSNLGRVRRKAWQIVKGKAEKGEYRRVKLCKDGEEKQFLVHRLVAEAFVPNPNSLTIVNHKDERPSNNRADNLEWCTYKHNSNWGTRNERISSRSANVSSVIATDIATGEETVYRSISEAAKSVTGKSSGGGSISEAAQGIRKTAYGKRWRYAKERSK